MQEPAACGALPTQHAKVHIGPVAIAAKGMLTQRTDRRRVDPSRTLETRLTVESKLCFFRFGTDRFLLRCEILSWQTLRIKRYTKVLSVDLIWCPE
jgi:hypothetical protein